VSRDCWPSRYRSRASRPSTSSRLARPPMVRATPRAAESLPAAASLSAAAAAVSSRRAGERIRRNASRASSPAPAPAAARATSATLPSRTSRSRIARAASSRPANRLDLSAIVREGVDEKTLSRAVGHLPYTALPGETGNFAIAAHRDTLFRALKDIKKDDRVVFESQAGTYTYEVISTKIVRPSDLSVVRPQGSDKLLTMITCYPFYYVGSAPKRFIVQAKLVSSNPEPSTLLNTGPPDKQAAVISATPPRVAALHSRREPRRKRGSSHLSRSRSRRSEPNASSPPTAHKKRGFWHKVFHPKSG